MTEKEYEKVTPGAWRTENWDLFSWECLRNQEGKIDLKYIVWCRAAEAAMVKHGLGVVKDEDGWRAVAPADEFEPEGIVIVKRVTIEAHWHPFAAIEAAVKVLETEQTKGEPK